MPQLSRGQKQKLDALTPAQSLTIGLGAMGAGLSFDISCFGVDASDKLSDDRYFVFFNQHSSPEGALKLLGQSGQDAQSFSIDLSRLPPTIRKLVFAITIDGGGEMRQLARGHFRIVANGGEVARFDFSGADFGGEKAIIAGEIYFKDAWRVAAVGQGFGGGLSALLKHFGGQESEDAAPASTCAPNTSSAANPAAWAGSAAGRSIAPVLSASSFALPTMSARNPTTSGGAPVCVRCGKIVGWIERARGFNEATKRCKVCEEEVAAALERFRLDFVAACAHGLLSPASWRQMWERFNSSRQNVTSLQALNYVRGDALKFMERLVTMAAADAVITIEEEEHIALMLQVLHIPQQHAAPIMARVEHLKAVTRIREGHLPLVAQSQHHLDAGEVCHLETQATYHKVNSRSVSMVAGRLVATSKKLHFLSATGGWTIQYKNIMRVEEDAGAIYLELSTRNGNGRYNVPEPLLAEAVVTTLTKLAKRQMLAPRGEGDSRHIPQDIKRAVWQRDGARCVQCQAQSYLEYDHVIPHSKGGASTLHNVQLLCRKCNLEKGDRI